MSSNDDVTFFEGSRWTYAMTHIFSTSNREHDELSCLPNDICYVGESQRYFSLFRLSWNQKTGLYDCEMELFAIELQTLYFLILQWIVTPVWGSRVHE